MSRQTGCNRIPRYVLIAALATANSAIALEQPDYTVLYTDGDIEYRQYDPYLVSETVVRGIADYEDAGTEGFRRLFRYISGGNSTRAEIAMTAPVARTRNSEKLAMTTPVQQGALDDGWRVTFMLPTQYTLQTAPTPNDDRVSIREVPGRLMAVLRYSGRWTAKNFFEKQSLLREAIDDAAIDRIGEIESAAYNPPFMPPFMRRNEVMVEVSALPAKATIN